MKTVNLQGKTQVYTDSQDREFNPAFINEISDALNFSADEQTQYDFEGEYIIEYDLTEYEDPIYWVIDSVFMNENGTASSVQIDC